MATQGLGLAFIAFPTIISEAPAGALIGVLFFGSLVIAGLTSLVSVIEVVISAVRDKFEMTRVGASMAVGVPAAVISLALFSTTSGVYVLDIVDHFINQYGILLVAVVSMLVVAWGARALGDLAAAPQPHRVAAAGAHLAGPGLVRHAAGAALRAVRRPGDRARQARTSDYPQWMLNTLGWGSAAAVLVFGLLAARVRWRAQTSLDIPTEIIPETTEER